MNGTKEDPADLAENATTRRASLSAHLSKSALLEETGCPAILRVVVLAGCMLTLFFLIWSAMMKVDEQALVSGEIQPTGELLPVQHLRGGRISAILVKDGDLVKADQILLRVDPTVSETQEHQAGLRLKNLRERKACLETILTGRIPDIPAGETASLAYADKYRAFGISADAMKQQIRQGEAELDGLGPMEKSLVTQKELLGKELSTRQALVEKGLNSMVLQLSLLRQQSGIEGELAQVPSQRRRLEARIAELKLRLTELETGFRAELLNDLAKTEEDLGMEEETLRRQKFEVNAAELRSPADGIVHGFVPKSVGAVVQPGECLLYIVPASCGLAAVARLSPKDAGHVRAGQAAAVRVTAYDFSRYGGVNGMVKEISPATLVDPAGSPYYKVIIVLEKDCVGRGNDSYPLLPGMLMQAQIKTGSKTVLSYLLKPVYNSVQGALRER